MDPMLKEKLQKPATFTPWANGKYEVVPGLKRFGTDFGNGERDNKIFQIDNRFFEYRQNKLEAIKENREKYFCTHFLSRKVEIEICKWMIKRLEVEWPDFFKSDYDATKDETCFFCFLTAEKIIVDRNFNLLRHDSSAPCLSLFEALCMQIQEDLAIWRLHVEGKKENLEQIHLCAPNHWAAQDKIGRSFFDVHVPVAEIEKVNKSASIMVDAMIYKGPYIRFVWGVATDQQLNHHPIPPIGVSPSQWEGRCFDPKNPTLFVRYERQTIWGFPEVGASLFAIRTYFSERVKNKESQALNLALAEAIKTMSMKSMYYKGLHQTHRDVIDYLSQ